MELLPVTTQRDRYSIKFTDEEAGVALRVIEAGLLKPEVTGSSERAYRLKVFGAALEGLAPLENKYYVHADHLVELAAVSALVASDVSEPSAFPGVLAFRDTIIPLTAELLTAAVPDDIS